MIHAQLSNIPRDENSNLFKMRVRLASCGAFVALHDVNDDFTLDTSHKYEGRKKRVFNGCSWSADGELLAAADGEKVALTIAKRGVFTTTEVETAPFIRQPTDVVVNKADSKLIIGGPHKVALYDVTRKKADKEFQLTTATSARLTLLDLSSSGSLYGVGFDGGQVVIINPVTLNVGVALKPFRKTSTAVSGLKFSRTRLSLLVVGSDVGQVALLDANAGGVVSTFNDHMARCSAVAVSPVSAPLIFTSGLDKRCNLYDVDCKKSVGCIRAPVPLSAVEPLPDGRTVALGSAVGGDVLFYDLRNFSSAVGTHCVQSANQPVVSLRYQPKSDTAVSSKRRGSVKENLLPPLSDEDSSLSSNIFSPVPEDGRSSSSINASPAQSLKSNHSFFSPLRETNSLNRSSFLKTPVGSFNKSTPLISPLIPIREDDIRIEEEDIEEEADKIDSKQDSEPTSNVNSMKTTSKSTIPSFNPVNIASSTPFKSPTSALGTSADEMRAVMTAFPGAIFNKAAHTAVNTTSSVLVEDKGGSVSAKGDDVGATAFQRQYVQNCVAETMDDFCTDLRMHLWQVQYDQIRNFQAQTESLEAALLHRDERCKRLEEQIERLQHENYDLKRYL